MSPGFLFAMSLPALVAALFVLAVVERFVRGKKKGTRSCAYVVVAPCTPRTARRTRFRINGIL